MSREICFQMLLIEEELIVLTDLIFIAKEPIHKLIFKTEFHQTNTFFSLLKEHLSQLASANVSHLKSELCLSHQYLFEVRVVEIENETCYSDIATHFNDAAPIKRSKG
jgi:hypothetical protein